MQKRPGLRPIIFIGIVCGLLLLTVFLAGCTSTAPVQPVATTPRQPFPTVTVTTAMPAETSHLVPVSDNSCTESDQHACTGLHRILREGHRLHRCIPQRGFPKTRRRTSRRYIPGTMSSSTLTGRRRSRHQVENGAYADVFISASNSYTPRSTARAISSPGRSSRSPPTTSSSSSRRRTRRTSSRLPTLQNRA